jgi:hypothetical protein
MVAVGFGAVGGEVSRSCTGGIGVDTLLPPPPLPPKTSSESQSSNPMI